MNQLSGNFSYAADPKATAGAYLAEVILSHLRDGEAVLWLVCGGSNIATAVAASRLLGEVTPGQLTIMLTDERYGEVGHVDSNWRQLAEDGFAVPGALMIPALDSQSLAASVISYAKALEKEFDRSDYAIGLFGLGADGHTGGILPGSAGATAIEFAVGYDAGTFIRITVTAAAIARLDEVVLVAEGANKWPQLERLAETIAPVEQPVQLLKTAASWRVYSDYKETTQ